MSHTIKPSIGGKIKTTHETACIVRSPAGMESDWPRDHHTRDLEAKSNYCYGFVGSLCRSLGCKALRENYRVFARGVIGLGFDKYHTQTKWRKKHTNNLIALSDIYFIFFEVPGGVGGRSDWCTLYTDMKISQNK